MRRSVSLFLSCKINQRGRPIITGSQWWFASQKAATLLPRNVPRTVRVRPTKQGNGNPTKGGLSLFLSSFHHGTMLSVRRTSALLRFSDSTRDFFPFTPRPHIIHSFQPLAPFLSSLPIISRYLQQSVQVSWPTRIVDGRPLRSLWPTYVFGTWWLLYRIAYVGIVDDNQSHHGKEGNERRIFLNEYFVDFLQYFFR